MKTAISALILMLVPTISHAQILRISQLQKCDTGSCVNAWGTATAVAHHDGGTYLLTAKHCVFSQNPVVVHANGTRYEAQVSWRDSDPEADTAIIYVPEEQFKKMIVYTGGDIPVRVDLCGYAEGRDRTHFRNIRTGSPYGTYFWAYHATPMGMSGGPAVCIVQGRPAVCGVISASKEACVVERVDRASMWLNRRVNGTSVASVRVCQCGNPNCRCNNRQACRCNGKVGSAGKDGRDGVDGKDGKDGKDADMSRVAALEQEVYRLKNLLETYANQEYPVKLWSSKTEFKEGTFSRTKPLELHTPRFKVDSDGNVVKVP